MSSRPLMHAGVAFAKGVVDNGGRYPAQKYLGRHSVV